MDLENCIESCIRQNRKAQEQLYQLYKKTLFTLSLKYCANVSDAEDNLHNTFIEIFTSIHKYDKRGSFEGWIKRITINKAIDSYKKKLFDVPVPEYGLCDTTLEEDELDISADYLLTIIQELPHQYRLVFNLYELDDYSHQEIAEMLSISVNTSKSNLHRAKLILKQKIKEKQKNIISIHCNGK
ncbi:RNA polymerase sigma factor [Flavobacterium polysaccharolyticum]|uniref:RNA polymerase sigma factor n=1 Tax=Flavobacterium polysaccharolyticum TaxID=3133148 RepID=A0ABU9NM66_9FLAO